MTNKITLTALVTGIPPFVHGPQLRDGETRLQFLVRQHPDEWNNLIECMKRDFDVSAHTCNLLRSLNTSAIDDPIVTSKIEQWANHRLPAHYRTLKSLSDLHESLKERPLDLMGIDLVQILWPREKNPSGDKSAERVASEMGAEVISLETGINREMDLAHFLPHVKGTYLWLMPGGSRFLAPMIAMSLRRILTYMESNPLVAVYFDGSYSLIYRVSALKEIASKTGIVPLNQQNITNMLREAGYSPCSDRGPECALCEIEQIYGGNYPFPRPAEKRSWLRRLFGG